MLIPGVYSELHIKITINLCEQLFSIDYENNKMTFVARTWIAIKLFTYTLCKFCRAHVRIYLAIYSFNSSVSGLLLSINLERECCKRASPSNSIFLSFQASSSYKLFQILFTIFWARLTKFCVARKTLKGMQYTKNVISKAIFFILYCPFNDYHIENLSTLTIIYFWQNKDFFSKENKEGVDDKTIGPDE